MGDEQAVVGRRAELEATLRLLARARGGLAALLLTGAPGVGKTTVWRQGVERAGESGFKVLVARPAGAEVRLSYAGLGDLFGDLADEELARLPAVQRRALEIALLRRSVGASPVDARAVATAVLSLLSDLSRRAPVLVAVDDAQWLDTPTRAALAFAVRRVEAAPVGVLATLRVEADRPPTFVEAIPDGLREEAAVGPLSVASLHAIIRRELDWAPPRPTLVKIETACDGNPFYALEVARELQRVGPLPPAGPLPVPARVSSVLRRRLERLPARTRSALLAASCLTSPSTALVDAGSLGPAEEAGIVRAASDGTLEFAHPLLAAAVYEAAPTARRRATHRRLAARVADPEERARHLALASAGPDAAVASALDTAALLARARGAPQAAAELAELALRLTPNDDPGRSERVLAAAGRVLDAGGGERADALLEQTIAETPDQGIRARALRLRGQLESRRSSFVAAHELAVAAARAAGEGGLRAGVELDLAFYRVSLGDFVGAEPHARAAIEQAEAAGDAVTVSAAFAVLTMVGFLGGRGVTPEALERLHGTGGDSPDLPLMLRPAFILALLLLWTGRLPEAVDALDALRLEALEQGREIDVPLLSLYLVWACLWRGEAARAERLAGQSLRLAALLDDRMARAIALSAGALVDAHAGRVAAARASAGEAIALFEQLGWRSGLVWPCWALGQAELAGGEPAAADAVLGPLAGLVAGLGRTDPVLSVFLPDEVEALVELGRGEEARSLLEPFEARARELERGWALAAAARCRGLLAAADGRLDDGVAALEEALAHHDPDMPVERARTLLELGRVERRRRHKRLARVALEEALQAFERCAAGSWAERTGQELARVATRRSPATLTASEERIARLAADGLTNRQVAERAFVAVTTVEANLKRVYRKLGITSRAQLARALDRPESAPIS